MVSLATAVLSSGLINLRCDRVVQIAGQKLDFVLFCRPGLDPFVAPCWLSLQYKWPFISGLFGLTSLALLDLDAKSQCTKSPVDGELNTGVKFETDSCQNIHFLLARHYYICAEAPAKGALPIWENPDSHDYSHDSHPILPWLLWIRGEELGILCRTDGLWMGNTQGAPCLEDSISERRNRFSPHLQPNRLL